MVAARRIRSGLALILVLVVATACSGIAASASPSGSRSEGEGSSHSASSSQTAMLPTSTEPAEKAPAGAIVLTVGPGKNYEPDLITAQAAESLTFYIDMSEADDQLNHNFRIGPELPPGLAIATSDLIYAGESAVVTVTGLAPGTYAFWCNIDDHYFYGMTGTLVVE
jgi:plastocyanin